MPIPLQPGDVTFVQLNRYFVSLKADRTCVWIISLRGSNNCYTMTRDGVVCACSCALPSQTVLDAELMPDGAFLVFDVLALRGEPVWRRTLTTRQCIVAALPPMLRIKQHVPLRHARALPRAEDAGFAADFVSTPDSYHAFDAALPVFKLQSPQEVTFDLDAETLRNFRLSFGFTLQVCPRRVVCVLGPEHRGLWDLV